MRRCRQRRRPEPERGKMTHQGQALQFVMTHGGPNLGLAGEQNRTQRLALGVRQGQRRLHTGPDNKGNPVGLQPGEKLAVMKAPVGPPGDAPEARLAGFPRTAEPSGFGWRLPPPRSWTNRSTSHRAGPALGVVRPLTRGAFFGIVEGAPSGSDAAEPTEPGQVREEAALRWCLRVPSGRLLGAFCWPASPVGVRSCPPPRPALGGSAPAVG